MEDLAYMTRVRRWLHQHPELSLQEEKTSAMIQQKLAQMGYKPVRIAETGVYADWVTDPKKPWLLFRADIDALPVSEATGLPFASKNPGVMHACGHDAHTAMLLGAARVIQQGRVTPAYNIRFAFQPAEEQYGGAKRMIEAGVLPEHLEQAYALHIWPQVPYGKIGFRRGTLMASNDYFQIKIQGKTAHAAMRSSGRDVLQAGAFLASQLPQLPAYHLPANHAAMVFVGTLQAGSTYNIVADQCELTGTARVLNAEDRDAMEQAMRSLTESIWPLYDVQAELSYIRQYPPLVSSEAACQEIRRRLDSAKLWEVPEPFMTGEDFAFFTEKVSGAMLLVGCGRDNDAPPLHSSHFTFDESLMELGLDAILRLAAC